MTGGRLKRIKNYLNNETFCFTYGDGLSDINIDSLVKFHKSHKKLATLTAVQPPGRYGSLKLDNEKIVGFSEKPKGDGGWINGGFFVLEPEVIDFISDDSTIWEKEPLQNLSNQEQLMSYFHSGFWQPMDTLRDKRQLEKLWQNNKAPWKSW